MLTAYDGREAGAGSALDWRERGDGHWIAPALGGHYELVPDDGRWKAWWRPSHGSAVDLGVHGTFGGASMAAKRHADAEQRMAAEDCAHTHPASVPSAPCPDPTVHAVAVATKVEAVRAEKVVVASEPGALAWRKKTYHTRRLGKPYPVDFWIAVVARQGEYEEAYVIWHHRGEAYDVKFERTRPERDYTERVGSFDTLAKARAAAERDWKKRRAAPKAERARRKKR